MSLFQFDSQNICPDLWLTFLACIIGLLGLLKLFMRGKHFKKKTTAKGKIVIVTGSNTGIGKETVRDLAMRGATVYMACRDMARCKEARDEIVLETRNEEIHCCECDLSSLESIKKFAERFRARENRLDILINNAGVMGCPRLLTRDGFEMHFGVNHMGHFYLTNLLLDLLKQSAPSRIVMISSLAHEYGKIKKDDLQGANFYSTKSAYSQSKLANVLFTRELAKRLKGSGVTVNALHPGVVDTEIVRHLGIFKYGIVRQLIKPIFSSFVRTAESGAQTTIYVALDPDLESVSGKYFSDCKLKEMAPQAKDEKLASWLWSESEKLLKVQVHHSL